MMGCCVCVCVQCRCLPLPSKDRDVADRFTSREKNKVLKATHSETVFFCWPGDLDLVPVQLIRWTTLDLNIQPWSSRQRASRLIDSTWRRRIVRACRSLFTCVRHRSRAPSSLPPSSSASLVLSTKLLPSLMLLLSLELPRWTLITLRRVLAASVWCS